MLEGLFAKWLWTPVNGHEFVHWESFKDLPSDADGAVICFPAQWQSEHLDKLNADLARLRWAVVVLFADEESAFPAHLIKHPNMKLWIQSPVPGKHDFADHYLLVGYPTHAPRMIAEVYDSSTPKQYDWFFSGQVTHARREECVEQLRGLTGGYLYETAGFTQGLDRATYYSALAAAKLAPAPSGPCTPDSFRLSEALEAGCIPIADAICPMWARGYDSPLNYWEYVFRQAPPFPVVQDWKTLPNVMGELLADWPASGNRVSAWWQAYKRRMAYDMEQDLNAVIGSAPESLALDDQITILIPTSPIPSHPDVAITEAVINSARFHFPRAEIILMFDGVRPQMEHRRGQFEEYTRRMLYKCEHEWHNVFPMVFTRHCQQAMLVRAALEAVKTPLVFFIEHDTPIVTDRLIDWKSIVEVLQSGEANMVRLYYFEGIHREHQYLMRDTVELHGSRFVKTIQYSQWPNLATVEFYKRILTDHFSPDQIAMIETVMYSPVVENSWDKFKIVIYTPDGNAQRFTHLNGRAGDPGDW